MATLCLLAAKAQSCYLRFWIKQIDKPKATSTAMQNKGNVFLLS